MNVLDLRQRLRLSRPQFARLVECSYATVYRWESKGVEPDGALLVIMNAIEWASRDPNLVQWLRACAIDGNGLRDVLTDLFMFWAADRDTPKEA